jgi:hypothetical protein
MKAGSVALVALLLGVAAAQYPWQEMTPLPFGASGKAVDDGGCLVAVPSDSVDRIWAAKGNSTTDAFMYDISAGAWEVRQPVPLGAQNKTVGIGARAVCDGYDNVFMVKGKYTLEFYRYSISADTWFQLPDVPLGVHGLSVRQGSDMVYVNRLGREHIYLLKGYWNEFYRFDVVTQTWEALTDAPVGVNSHYYDGSWLVYDGNSTVYCHKATYHEMWAFDVDSLVWRAGGNCIPLVGRTGRRTKAGDGCCATWLDGDIYALKGNYTTEFWRYFVQRDSWSEQDTIPSLGSTGRVKGVCDGADMAACGGVVYALKGNATNEFWRYDPGLTGMAGPGQTRRPRSVVVQSPVSRGRVRIAMSGSEAGLYRIDLYDPSGRARMSVPAQVRDGRAEVVLPNLLPGAYVLRVSGRDIEVTRPLTAVR